MTKKNAIQQTSDKALKAPIDSVTRIEDMYQWANSEHENVVLGPKAIACELLDNKELFMNF